MRASLSDRIRRAIRGKTIVRISGKSRNADGYDVLTPHGFAHAPNLKQAQVELLKLARIHEQQMWEIRAVKNGGQP